MDRDVIVKVAAKQFSQHPWDCTKCKEKFTNYNDLRRHGEDHHDIGKVGRLNGDLGDLVAHYCDVQTNRLKPNAKGEYICPDCKMAFSEPRQWGVHRSQEHQYLGLVHMQCLGQPNFKTSRERKEESELVAQNPEEAVTPKRRGRPRRNYKFGKITHGFEQQSVLSNPQQAVIMPEITHASHEGMSEPQLVADLQRTLATLNLLLAAQGMTPQQMIALSGTLGAIQSLKTE